MPSIGGSRCRSSATRAVVVVLAFAFVLAGTTPSVRAAPRPTIDEVRARVDALHEQAEAATERYNALRDAIADIGNGLMIHAPQTGDSVKIAPVDGIRSLTTAVRL